MILLLKKFWSFLAVIGAFVLGVLTIFFYGKSKGKQEVIAKQNNDIIKETLEIKKNEEKHNSDSIVDVCERMRKHTRDDG